jgi:hypothetical protein
MIKVIDSLGEVHTIPEALWNSLSKMKNCKFRLAEVPIPKEVIEFKPTPAKQPTEVDKLIDEKQCCKESCKEQVIPEITIKVIEVPQPEIEKPVYKPKNKGGRPKK